MEIITWVIIGIIALFLLVIIVNVLLGLYDRIKEKINKRRHE